MKCYFCKEKKECLRIGFKSFLREDQRIKYIKACKECISINSNRGLRVYSFDEMGSRLQNDNA